MGMCLLISVTEMISYCYCTLVVYLQLSSYILLLSLSSLPVVTACATKTCPIQPQLQQTRMASGYSIVPRGSLYTETHRLYFKNANGELISPMHDIPLSNTEGANEFNMIVEVPRWSNAKTEINLTEKFNPIKQDVKKGKPRFVANCFPHKGYIWNYGALPQTWEDPEHTDPHTNAKGDGDPVDVCDIGSKVHKSGSIIKVKILGTLAMIDEGETDWKMLAIDVTDELADKINDIEDIETHMPGFLAATVEWFKIYKMPDGKPPNEFAFDAKPKGRDFALEIIKSLNDQWKNAMSREMGPDGLCRTCAVYECSSKVDQDAANAAVDSAATLANGATLTDSVDKWHYVKL